MELSAQGYFDGVMNQTEKSLEFNKKKKIKLDKIMSEFFYG